MRFFCIHTIIFRYVSRHEVRAMTSHIYNNMSWSNVNLLRFFSPETVDCRLCRQVFWLASLSEVLPILYGQWTSVEFIRKVLWSSQQWVCSGVSPDSLFTSFNKIYHEAPESRILKSERKYRYYKSCKEEYSKKRENEFNVLFSLVSLLGSVLNTLWITPIYSLYLSLIYSVFSPYLYAWTWYGVGTALTRSWYEADLQESLPDRFHKSIPQKKRKKRLSVPNKKSTFVPDYSAPGSTKCFLSD